MAKLFGCDANKWWHWPLASIQSPCRGSQPNLLGYRRCRTILPPANWRAQAAKPAIQKYQQLWTSRLEIVLRWLHYIPCRCMQFALWALQRSLFECPSKPTRNMPPLPMPAELTHPKYPARHSAGQWLMQHDDSAPANTQTLRLQSLYCWQDFTNNRHGPSNMAQSTKELAAQM